MSVRVKLRTDLKTMIKFGSRPEEQWFIGLMRSIRDSDPKTHPPISIRDKDGEIPKLPKTKPVEVDPGKDIKELPPLPKTVDLEKVRKLMR